MDAGRQGSCAGGLGRRTKTRTTSEEMPDGRSRMLDGMATTPDGRDCGLNTWRASLTGFLISFLPFFDRDHLWTDYYVISFFPKHKFR